MMASAQEIGTYKQTVYYIFVYYIFVNFVDKICV